ncbi:sodium/proton-translocating pyrophosphatase [Zhaonella formicivorans]
MIISYFITTDDTVGDPFKDTSGPAMNILSKLMTVVPLVFAPLFMSN